MNYYLVWYLSQTDGKWRIWANRAICTGGLKKQWKKVTCFKLLTTMLMKAKELKTFCYAVNFLNFFMWPFCYLLITRGVVGVDEALVLTRGGTGGALPLIRGVTGGALLVTRGGTDGVLLLTRGAIGVSGLTLSTPDAEGTSLPNWGVVGGWFSLFCWYWSRSKEIWNKAITFC